MHRVDRTDFDQHAVPRAQVPGLRELRLCARRHERAVALSLEYHGQPLDPAEARRSLELLYPGRDRAGHRLNAVGLGLGMLRALARRQGGDLSLLVGPDGVATLALTMPVAPAR